MAVSGITIPPGLALILDRAGNKSDVDFDYLLQTAVRESSLNAKAKASTSSATGLFQFLEQTWFEVMKTDGSRLGYERYANAITRQPDGSLNIADKDLRAEVLKLREDPGVAADLAAAFTRNNGAYLKNAFGRMPSPGELYIAHFLGAKGAEKLFQAGLSDPDQIAARLFPSQAQANPSIFYDKGKARSIRELYQVLVARHDAVNSTVTASTPQSAPQTVTAPVNMSFADLYNTGTSTPDSRSAEEPKVNAGFFAQLYSN